MIRRSRRALAGLGTCAALLLTGALASASTATPAVAAQARPAGDGPPGFWWGTDSLPVTVPGTAPYRMPYLGGAYGGYIGMTGNWAYWLGCAGQEHFLAFSATDNAQAHANYVTHHLGVGSGAYWFMGGPGVDPAYNGTTSEASSWGARQAARALADIANGTFDYKVVWMDVELPGLAPAPDNGWNTVYTSPCSGAVRQSSIPTSLDRADFNGFANYVAAHSSYKVGVYSSAGVWSAIFGTGTDSLIPDTYEWTYEPETTDYAGANPHGWCLGHGAGPCAEFFGGQTSSSPYALMWQWSGGGGVTNGIGGFNGDLDTIDGSRLP
ncbi:MAG TPA: hypothetical protein VME19_21285 [Streptosporangiaceae bacterium]|nr:hypothetical protein [Streptosporangiaceae bacterium]